MEHQQLNDMASPPASPRESSSLEKHLKCSICMEIFNNPVTTTCGHSFCKTCLDCTFQYNDRACPLCKMFLQKTPEVNIILRDIAQEQKLKNDDLCVLKANDVPCDICTVKKRKAQKSCLMCLASYCSAHLENHHSSKRLKGHKLVAPVKNLDERACLKHGRPLELYTRKQQRCICVGCLEEDPEDVVSAEVEWDQKKEKLEKIKTVFQGNIRNRESESERINTSLRNCKEQLDNEWWNVEAVFAAIIAIVEKAQANVLQPLEDRRKVVEQEATELNEGLREEITSFEATISELEDLVELDDHVLFLQSFPTLPDLDSDMMDVEFDSSLSFGTMRKTIATMLEQIQEELEKLTSIELKRISKFTVDVKLDPATAHQRLVVSDDGKEVKDGGEDKEGDEAPERFDLFGSILGVDHLTYQRSYWEVDVGRKTGWDLGVAKGEANRKGSLSLSPDNGYWVTVHYEGDKYAAMTDPPLALYPSEEPRKVGVFVDYEEGVVSFYNVAAQAHIFSFTECSFDGDVFPYFSPHLKHDAENADPLVIERKIPSFYKFSF